MNRISRFKTIVHRGTTTNNLIEAIQTESSPNKYINHLTMKINAFTLSLLCAGSVSAIQTLERDLQTCPTPQGFTCTMDLNPVKCGSNACEYDNQCIANAAGYTPTLCWPSSCLDPLPTVTCTTDSNPVSCGDAGCEYANYCNAEAAGFPPTVCEALNCPPPGSGACTMDYDPQVCLAEGIGLCRYDNECIAASAGFDSALGRCMKVDEYINNVMGACPVVPVDTVCPLIYQPIKCEECYYVSGSKWKMVPVLL
jgi:hypothetical protein